MPDDKTRIKVVKNVAKNALLISHLVTAAVALFLFIAINSRFPTSCNVFTAHRYFGNLYTVVRVCWGSETINYVKEKKRKRQFSTATTLSLSDFRAHSAPLFSPMSYLHGCFFHEPTISCFYSTQHPLICFRINCFL